MLQKVNWVCEEDELSTGTVEFEGPTGYSCWDGAGLGGEGGARGLWWRLSVLRQELELREDELMQGYWVAWKNRRKD